MFDIEKRKKHTECVFSTIDKSLAPFTSDQHVKGVISYYLHNIIVGFMIVYLTFGWINRFYYAMIIFYLSLFVMHFYFGGCICIRTERKFWKRNDWKGMWTLTFEILERLGLTLTPSLETNVYFATSVCMSFVVILRLVMHWM